jgi:hypothetical protein
VSPTPTCLRSSEEMVATSENTPTIVRADADGFVLGFEPSTVVIALAIFETVVVYVPTTSPHRFVSHSSNNAFRAHPAGDPRKLPRKPADPGDTRAGKPRSRAESTPIPAQAGSATPGLSRRRSRDPDGRVGVLWHGTRRRCRLVRSAVQEAAGATRGR